MPDLRIPLDCMTDYQKINQAIVIKITHGHGTLIHTNRGGKNISEGAISEVSPNLREVIGISTCKQDVQVSVIVKIPPCDRARSHTRQCSVDVGEGAVA